MEKILLKCNWHFIVKSYVDANVALRMSNAGDIMSGRLDMGGNRINDVYDPTSNHDVATKKNVDIQGANIDAAIILVDNKPVSEL